MSIIQTSVTESNLSNIGESVVYQYRKRAKTSNILPNSDAKRFIHVNIGVHTFIFDIVAYTISARISCLVSISACNNYDDAFFACNLNNILTC